MTLIPFLLTVLAVLAAAFVVFSLVHLIATDGVSRQHVTPPRSHPRDEFDPRRYA